MGHGMQLDLNGETVDASTVLALDVALRFQPPFSSLMTVCQCLTLKHVHTLCTRGTIRPQYVQFMVQ